MKQALEFSGRRKPSARMLDEKGVLMGRVLAVVLVLLGGAAGSIRAQVYEGVEVANGGTIVGTVSFVGTPPPPKVVLVGTDPEVCGTEARLSRALIVDDNGGVRDTVVNLGEIESGKPWPRREYLLRQSDCRFDPHILLIPEGEDLHLVNTDRILHIVRSVARDSVFNVGQPRFVVQYLVENFAKQIANRKAVRLVCDLHGWMEAYAVIQKHPYYAVTGLDGSFRIEDVPPGEYELELWHQILGEESRRIMVSPNKETVVQFERSLPEPADD